MIRMFRFHISKPVFVLALADVFVLYVAVVCGITFSFEDVRSLLYRFENPSPYEFVFIAAEMLGAIMMGIYQRQFLADIKIIILRLIAANALAFFMLSTAFYIFPSTRLWMSALLPAFLVAFVFMLGTRWVFLRAADLDRFKRRVLVIGAGAQASDILKLSKRGNVSCVGFVPVANEESKIDSSKLFSEKESLVSLAEAHEVEEIVVAMQERRGGLPTEKLLACRLKGIQISDFWTFMERQKGQVELEFLKPSWMIFAEGFSSTTRLQRIVKRLFDVTVSLLLLFFTLPVTLITAAFVFLQDRGPIFYKQERVGLYGDTFFLLKFRSMRTDAEKDGVARWAAAGDTRVTKFGQFIRLTRIDEIPQVINVLRGEMSFIGPRPERPQFVEELAEHIPFYHYRDTVKPGITGWAQINYPYGASIDDAKQKLKYDLFYIKNYSLLLDFIILLQTVRVVLWPQGVR